MLIEFNVTNFRSIYSTQTLTLVADSDKELLDSNTCLVGFSDLPRLVNSAVIYGPNAAGKSNFIRAIGFMQAFVKNSAKNSDDSIEVEPFRLQKNEAPCEFELIFIQAGMRYQYGFAVTAERVWHEWLFAYPNGNGEQWLERCYDAETQQESWFVSEQLISGTDLRELWQAATKPKVLFLSMAEVLNMKAHSYQLADIFEWITETLVVLGPQDALLNDLTMIPCEEPLQKSAIMKLLRAADLNIIDINVETRRMTHKDLPDDIPPALLQARLGKPHKTLQFWHYQNETYDKIPFAPADESDGTRQLFALAGPVMDQLTKGQVLIVDDFDNHLHPIIVRFLVKLFHYATLKKPHAQLVVTTHDSATLDSTLLRRDQVWFVQKDQQQASQLYPLTDFQPRPFEAWQRDYLEGRYGALPLIGELKFDGNG